MVCFTLTLIPNPSPAGRREFPHVIETAADYRVPSPLGEGQGEGAKIISVAPIISKMISFILFFIFYGFDETINNLI
jgi:hypothetical protein